MARATPTPLTLNGSHGEGGGALLRTALTMAALTDQPVRIHNVRGAMRKKGLTSEDLTFVRILEASTDAEVSGDQPGSGDLSFRPRRAPRGVVASFDMGAHEEGNVPGNALIVLQSALPVLARSGMLSRVVVTGETYNANALSYDAFELCTLAAHRKQGLYAYANQEIGGFGFAARGEVGLDVEPSALEGIEWESRGRRQGVKVVVATGDLPEDVGQRGVRHAKAQLDALGLDAEVEHHYVRSRSPGAFVTVAAEFENGTGCGVAMGQRGLRAEKLVENAIESFREWYESRATVDPYLADQLLVPAVIAGQASVFTTSRITQRLMTMAWVIKQFTPIHITILGREGEPGTVRIHT